MSLQMASMITMRLGGPGKVTLAAILTIGLAGCESSARLAGFGRPEPQVISRQDVAPEPLTPLPTPQVQSAPLGAPGGVQTAAPPPTVGPDGQLIQPQLDANGQPIPPTQTPKAPPKVAVAPKPADVAPAEPSAPTRSGVTGNWSVSEAAGGKCRATLSSLPTLDLYKASTSGCASKELQRITAWELRGSDIYLYEAGGAVAARLHQSGSNSFNGAASKSGAPITLSK